MSGGESVSKTDWFDEPAEENNDLAGEPDFRPSAAQVEDLLWRDTDEDSRAYCIIDGEAASRRSVLYGRLLGCSDISWAHMWQGRAATKDVLGAPYIISLKRGHPLARHIIEEGWGRSWGIFFTASIYKANWLYPDPPRFADKRFLPSNQEQLKLGNLAEGESDPLWKVRRHFRRHSDVFLEPLNKLVDFRYWEPWTAVTYMLSSGRAERRRFAGPVTRFLTEDTGYYRQFYDSSYYCLFDDEHFFRLNFKNEKYIEGAAYAGEAEESYSYVSQPYRGFYPIITKQKFEIFSQAIEMSAVHYTYGWLAAYIRGRGVRFDADGLDRLCEACAKSVRSYGAPASDLGLRVRFTLCAVIYGFGFERHDARLKEIIAAPSFSPAAMKQRLDELLEGKTRD